MRLSNCKIDRMVLHKTTYSFQTPGANLGVLRAIIISAQLVTNLGSSGPSSFLPSWLQTWGCLHAPLRIDNSLEWVTELRKELYYEYSFILIKDTNQNKPKGKAARVRFGKAANMNLLLSSEALLGISVFKRILPMWEGLLSFSVQRFCFLFHYVGMIEQIIAQCRLTSTHFSPSKSQADILVAQSSNHQITWLVFQAWLASILIHLSKNYWGVYHESPY